MRQLRAGDLTIDVDDDGFFQDTARWNEAIARALAAAEGIVELTDDHWTVIHYLRDHYREFGVPPMIRKLCGRTGFTLKRIYELFPAGPAKGACKVAGLPSGKGCV